MLQIMIKKLIKHIGLSGFLLTSAMFCQNAFADGFLLPDDKPKDDWVEKQQGNISGSLDKTAKKMDNWFGKTDPNEPATASLQVIVDTDWNETDGTHSNIRLRGRVKLPTLERKLSVVFGDDRLEDRSSRKNRYSPLPNPQTQSGINNLDSFSTLKQENRENSSLAVRWSDFSDKLPFETDFDVGIRLHGNVFARLKASKDWQLTDNSKLFTEQTYRYSKRDKNEFFSYWEWQYRQDKNTDISTPTNIEYHENYDDDLNWNTSLLQTHYYSNQRKLSYGLYADGFVNDNQAEVNRTGAIVSWRQPIWREWLFLQTDVDYLDDKRENRDHEFGGLVRLEMLF